MTILIIIVFSGAGYWPGVPAITSINFNNLKGCETAKSEVMSSVPQDTQPYSDIKRVTVTAMCVAQGVS